MKWIHSPKSGITIGSQRKFSIRAAPGSLFLTQDKRWEALSFSECLFMLSYLNCSIGHVILNLYFAFSGNCGTGEVESAFSSAAGGVRTRGSGMQFRPRGTSPKRLVRGSLPSTRVYDHQDVHPQIQRVSALPFKTQR